MEPCASVFCNKSSISTGRCGRCNKKGNRVHAYCSKKCQIDCWEGKKGNLKHKDMCKFFSYLLKKCISCKTIKPISTQTRVCDSCHRYICAICIKEKTSLNIYNIKCSCNTFINLKKEYSIKNLENLLKKNHPFSPLFEYKLSRLLYKQQVIKFFDCLKNSVKKGYVRGCFDLGLIYYFGFTVDKLKINKDYELAYFFFINSFKKGFLISSFYLGLMFKNIKKDFDTSIFFFEICLKFKSKIDKLIDPFHELGMIYFETNKYEKSFLYFQTSFLIKKNKNSTVRLVEMYKNGLGVEKNIEKSLEYFNISKNFKDIKYPYKTNILYNNEF